MKAYCIRVSVILALGTFIVLTFISLASHALEPLIIGQNYHGTMLACAEKEDALDIVTEEIGKSMDEAMALYEKKNAEGKCFYGFTHYVALRTVATAKNKATTSYVLEVDLGGMTVYALSKAELVPVKRTSM